MRCLGYWQELDWKSKKQQKCNSYSRLIKKADSKFGFFVTCVVDAAH